MVMVKKQKTSDEEEPKGPRWQDMKYDMLAKIFSTFTLLEVALSISNVCQSWRAVCLHAVNWDTLDFSRMKEHFYVPAVPDAWSDPPFSTRFWDILKSTTCFADKNLTKIIFNFHICITDSHLIFLAERCPNVKLLVLPSWSMVTTAGYEKSFQIWKGLEAVVLPGCTFPFYIIELLGENCKKLTSLKISGYVTKELLAAVFYHLPSLKALSIKSSMLKRETLLWMLQWMKELEELNISHSYLIDMPLSEQVNLVDQTILERSAWLKAFHYCQNKNCFSCLSVEGLEIGSSKRRDLAMRLDDIEALSY